MIIPKEDGDPGFSAIAHSAVVTKLASRSITAAVTAMVPNSLGPAELILRYGTEAQKRLLSLAAALLGYGLPAHRVEEAVARLSRAFGRSCTVFGLPTALTLTLYGASGSDSYTVRAEQGATDLSRLDALHHVGCSARPNPGRTLRAQPDGPPRAA